MATTVHILHPKADGDKCVCGVRLSQGDRRSANTPHELTCERCYLKCLRSWQALDENVDPVPATWPSWPWEHPSFTFSKNED